MRAALVPLAALAFLAACQSTMTPQSESKAQEDAQQMQLASQPPMRWGQAAGSDQWTQATLSALDREGVTILSRVPGDISAFCPNYENLNPTGRKAFWAGLLSAVAKHESTYNPKASGGGGYVLGRRPAAAAGVIHHTF